MEKIYVYVEKGYLNTVEGLEYLQKAVESKLNNQWIANIVDFEIEYNQLWEKEMTKLEIETNCVNPIDLSELVVNTFNRRRRFIKNK